MDAKGVLVPAEPGDPVEEAAHPARPRGLRALLAGRGTSVYRRLLLEAVLVAAMAVAVLRVPSASRDVTRALARIDTARLGWLPVAILTEVLAFASYAEAQRRLLVVGGVRMSRRALLGTTLGANAINLLVPLGALPAGGWTVARYREHDAPTSLALWAVLAGGFTATMVVLILAVAGAAIADVAGFVTLAIAGALLIAGSAVFVAAVHRLPAIDGRLQRNPHRRGVSAAARLVHRATGAARELIRWRVGPRGGAAVIACSLGNWLAEAACLAAAFAMVGYPVPWRSLLFAFAVSQLAGSLVPLPGGLGAVEGGLVGVLTVTGTPVGQAISATIVYRVISYWGVAATGAVILAVRARRASRVARSSQSERPGRPGRSGRSAGGSGRRAGSIRHVDRELVQPGPGRGVAGGTPVAAR